MMWNFQWLDSKIVEILATFKVDLTIMFIAILYHKLINFAKYINYFNNYELIPKLAWARQNKDSIEL